MSINGSSGLGSSSSAAKMVKHMSIKNMTKWNVAQTLKWLRKAGFGDCERYFVEHKINGRALLMLDEDDLKEVVRDNVGQRKNLFHLIKTMQLKYRNYVHSSSFEDDDDEDDNEKDEEDEDDEKNSSNSNSIEDEDALEEGDEEQSDKESLADDEDDADDSRRRRDVGGHKKRPAKKKHGNANKTSPDNDDDGAKTTDDEADAERMLKNSSFIRNKVKLGAGLDLRNRGSSWKNHSQHRGRRGSPHQSQNSSFYESPNGYHDHHHHHHHNNNNNNEDDDFIIDTQLSHDLCESCAKKLDYSIMNGVGGLASSSSHHNMMNGNGDGSQQSPLRSYRGEKRKTFLAVVYLFVTCLWTSFMLTVVHDRVPDMEKYPPLPDIILDNVPLIPWAFFATECIGIVLGLILFAILVMHKYRWIIFRRMCGLGSTIFFLRSITMLITSLSVPGVHIQCSSQRYGSLMNKLYGAWNILSGVGLYVQGVRTCGDYMFSGHTVWLTLLTHFITEYTPSSMNWLHTFTWVLNVFGLFFILGAHEHYSIDVFIAFYISSRLFLYYHSLANNKVLFQGDHKRVKIWFPLFSYFESNIRAIVPNEFEWPPNFIYRGYRSARNKLKKAINGGNNGSKSKSNKSPLSNLSCQANS